MGMRWRSWSPSQGAPVIKFFMALPQLCDGCRICELACSLAKAGRVNPYLGRIRVLRDKDGGAHPLYCRHCARPLCQEACPIPQAMTRDSATGAVAIHQEHCIGCMACAQACPFHAIWVGPDREMLKCDLCGGDPVCVRYCPSKPGEDQQAPAPLRRSCLRYVDLHQANRR